MLAAATACSGSSSAPTAATPPAVALRPSGASARAVAYHCVHGRVGSITVSVPDLRRLADALNPINVCEFDGGLADLTITVSCAGGSPARVHVQGVDGKVPATASAAC